MVCKDCNRQSRQVILRSRNTLAMDTEEIKRSLCPSKTKMLLEVIKGPWSNAYLHFATKESASVFFHQYNNKELIINGVKYAFKQINFSGLSAAATPTPTNTTAVSTAAPAPVAAIPVRAPVAAPVAAAATAPTAAAAHSSEWVSNAKRALVSLNDEIRELKKRRKYLKKALRRS
ncbi:hypothetical protein PS15p_207480 [Mucor circinelloides]